MTDGAFDGANNAVGDHVRVDVGGVVVTDRVAHASPPVGVTVNQRQPLKQLGLRLSDASAGHATTWRCACRRITATRSSSIACVSGRIAKGSVGVALGRHEELDGLSGRRRVPLEHLGARPVFALLELDQMLACDAAHQLADAVVGQAGISLRLADPLRERISGAAANPFLEFQPISHVAYL